MDSDEDALIEEEIQQELDKLTEADLESSENSNVDLSSSEISQTDNTDDNIPDEFDTYLKSIQAQTTAFELDLAECDDLLQQSVEITSSRDVGTFDDELKLELLEGENLEELKLKILEDISKDNDTDEDLFNDSDEEDFSSEAHDDNKEEKALVVVTSQQLEFRELLAGQKQRIQDDSKKQEDQVQLLIEKERHEEEIFEQEIETKRQEMRLQIEREESRLQTARKEREVEEEKQKMLLVKQLEMEMEQQQAKMKELEAKAKKEKEEYEHRVKEEEIRQENKKQTSATKIQSVYKGYRTRKQYKTEVDSRWKEAQKRRREERVKQIEEEQRQYEEEQERQKKLDEEKRLKDERKQEEERKKKEEAERKKKEEDERKQREKEEKQRKAEEERLRKEEEKRRKEEEKRQKAEEERLRKEEEKRRKGEEKRLKEEEKKKKEEEARLRKEEEIRKKKEEEERKKQEEKERKEREEEEKRQKLEKERQEKEVQKRLKEEQQLKEMEKIRSKKTELDKQEEELRKQEEKLKQFLDEETVTNGDTEHSNQLINGGRSPRKSGEINVKTPRKSVRSSKEGKLRESCKESLNLEADPKEKLKNGLSSMEGLPGHLEEKRLSWIKSCLPWSKVSNEPWKLKASTSKRPPRRPSSAKKLPLLAEDIILSAAKMASLRQVTTVELKDLPGSNMSTLGQCTGLQYLKMVDCNLVAVEGLQNCKQLQYLDLKRNKIEYVDLKSLGSIKFIDLSNNCLSVIHGLDGCTDVRWLDLSDNKITRLGGLNGLRRLHTLKLARNQLINTAGLGDTPTVQQLDLSHNHLQEVEEISKLCLLQHLNISSNNILQIPDLENHVLLQELFIDDNSITSMECLSQSWLPLVQKLNISQNSLEDLVSLENLLLLRELDVSNNQVLDIDVFQSSLKCYIYLEILRMGGNPAVESVDDLPSFRSQLTDTLTRLHQIDDQSVTSSQHGLPVKPRNSFEAMCLHQVQIMKDIHHRFQQDLKSHLDSSSLSELCDIYFKFCDKTHKIAEDHRYAHEYGEMSIAQPTAPSTPKSGRPRSARANKIAQESYMSPKEMFEKALQGGGGNGSGSNGLIRGDNVAVVKPVISAKTVQNILEDDPASQKKLHIRHEAATKIQSVWRGYIIRAWYRQVKEERGFDMAVLQELHKAAVKIQAMWRGFSLRNKLEKALDFARFEDDEELGEIDMNDLNFNEDILNDWRPPSTPQLPNSHAVLGKPPSGKKPSPPKIPSLPLTENHHHPPNQPRRAWRGADSPLSDIQQNHPRPPSSLVSGTDTHRTGLSKKEEKLSEEWGFKNTNTAHLMMQRAKKMKYNAERRKKISKLDPKQKLCLFRKMEEVSHYPYVQPPRKILPRKEYFQERQKEIEHAEREKRIEKNERVNRTFEWLHTQVGDYDVSDSAINSNSHGTRTQKRFGSDGNLPRLDSDLMAGKPVRLVGSPVDIQSLDSVSIQGEFSKPRRFSAGSSDSTRLPPIKGGSAPTGQKRVKERISFRNPANKNTDIGWGSGQKRSVH